MATVVWQSWTEAEFDEIIIEDRLRLAIYHVESARQEVQKALAAEGVQEAAWDVACVRLDFAYQWLEELLRSRGARGQGSVPEIGIEEV